MVAIRASRARVFGAVLIAAAIAASGVFAVRAWQSSRRLKSGPHISLPNDATTDASPAPRAPGCGVSEEGPSDRSMTTRGGRAFHVWGPSRYDEKRAYPVVLTFHGWGSSGRDFAKWFKMQEHVEGAAFTVYPDSKGAMWDFDGDTDLDYTAEILESLAVAFCIDRARVLAFGFSYGARFVHHLGCKRPHLVRAIAAGGGAWDPETGCRPMPVFVTHRTHDPTMLIAGGIESAARWAKVDGCLDDTEPTDSADGCRGYRGCAAGGVTFCEDVHVDPSWPRDWDHTVREGYRSLTWKWFNDLR